MTAAVWSDFSPLITPQNLKPAFRCASGNCSWANSASITVCHKREDISQSLVKTTGRTRVCRIFLPERWGNDKPPDVSNQGLGVNTNQNQKNLIYIKYQVLGTNLSLSNYNGKIKCTRERQLSKQVLDDKSHGKSSTHHQLRSSKYNNNDFTVPGCKRKLARDQNYLGESQCQRSRMYLILLRQRVSRHPIAGCFSRKSCNVRGGQNHRIIL